MKAGRFFLVAGGMGMVLLVALFGSAIASAHTAPNPEQPATTPIPTATLMPPHIQQATQEVHFSYAQRVSRYGDRNIRIEPDPPQAGEELEFFIDVVNEASTTKSAIVEFSVAQLGTGQAYDNVVNLNHVQLPPNSTTTVSGKWFPPDSRGYCVFVRLIVDGQPVADHDPWTRDPDYDVFRMRNLAAAQDNAPPGTSVDKPFQVCNPHNEVRDISLNIVAGRDNHPGCRASLDRADVIRLQPGECTDVTLTIHAPDVPDSGSCVYYIERDDLDDGIEFVVPIGPTPTPTNTPVPQPEVPEPPENLEAEKGRDAILLTWEPGPSPNIVGYYVYRRVRGETNFTRITNSLVTVLNYRDTTFQTNTIYEYYVTAINEDERESAPSEIADANFGALRLVVPDTQVQPGQRVEIPVNIENGDGLCIGAGNIAITYDPAIATFVDLDSTPLTVNYAFERGDRSTNNELYIATISSQTCEDLVGPGSLFVATFDISPNAQESSRLDFITTGLTTTAIYDRDNLNTPLTVELDNGLLIIDEEPFVLGDLNGDEVVNAADAAIALQIASGEREPTPEQLRAGDINGDGVINAADAAAILYYAANQEWPVAGQEVFVRGDLNGDGQVHASDAALILQIATDRLEPTPEQQRAGDVNGDGIINAADASATLYYATNQRWPGAEEATVVLGDLNGDGLVRTDDAAIALVIAAGEREPTPEQQRAGDVNGDGVINDTDAHAILYYAANEEWPDAITAPNNNALAQQGIIVSPDIVTGTVGSTVRVPIRLSNTTAVRSATVEVQYPTGLNLRGVELDDALDTNDILQEGDYQLRFHETADGRRVRVSLAGASDLPTGEQPVAWLVFEVEGQTQVGTQLAQDTSLLPVTVTGAWLSDAAGRDFSTSAIDQPVNGGDGGVQVGPGDPILRGDCNGDEVVDAGDISALVLRIFEGRFADQPGCDVNGDEVVDAGDISALVLLIFNQTNQPVLVPGNLAQAPVGVPSLTLPATLSVGEDGKVALPLTFASDGTEISSLVFALEIDPEQLRIDPTDADGDGLLDALQASVPAGFEVQTPVLDTETGKIGLLIADLSPPLTGLSDGTLLTLELEAVDTTAETLRGAVGFADDPAASFGDTSGRSVPGSTSDGLTDATGRTVFLPTIRR